MIGAQPKRKNPETGKVDPDRYYGDIKTERKYLLDFANAINSQRSIDEPKVDGTALVQKMLKRVAKFYNHQSKYDGSGNLKEGF